MPPFEDLVYEKKKLVIDALFAGELLSLATELGRLAEALGHPLEHETLATCITEVSACLPVYRTYISGEADHDDGLQPQGP